MELSIVQIILIFLVAGLAGCASILDAFQFHRPLIACTLLGLVLGDMKTGIIIGGSLELIALGWINIGAAVAPDAALASIISTLLVIVGKQEISSAIALAIPIAAAGQVLSIIVRAITVGIQHLADQSAKDGDLLRIELLHIGALSLQFLRVGIPALIVALTAGTDVVQSMLNSIPEVITKGLQIAGGFIAVVGYAMVINMMRVGYLMPFFFLGFVTAAFSSFNLVAFGIIGAILAMLYLQLHPKYSTAKNSIPTIQDNGLDNRLD